VLIIAEIRRADPIVIVTGIAITAIHASIIRTAIISAAISAIAIIAVVTATAAIIRSLETEPIILRAITI
jgi:hypothetical protein